MRRHGSTSGLSPGPSWSGSCLAALVSFVWTPHDPMLVAASNKLREPGGGYLLGADKFGRDTLSQLMVGARTTLYVGIVAVGIAALIGTPLGVIAGDDAARLAGGAGHARSTTSCSPSPRCCWPSCSAPSTAAGTLTAMIAIGVATVPAFARVAGAATMQVMVTDYILAARAAGRRRAGDSRAARAAQHRLGMLIVQASVSFAIAILAEAALSFLGFGTRPPMPSWGRMLQESQELLFTAPRLALVPGPGDRAGRTRLQPPRRRAA